MLNMTKLTELLDRVYGEVQKVQDLDDDTLTDEWKEKNWKRLKYVLLVNHCGTENAQRVGRMLAQLYPKLKFSVTRPNLSKAIKLPDYELPQSWPTLVLNFEGPVDVVDLVHEKLKKSFGVTLPKVGGGYGNVRYENKRVMHDLEIEVAAMSEAKRRENAAKRREEERKRLEAKRREARVRTLTNIATTRKNYKIAADELRADRIAKANAIREGVRKRHADFLASRRRVSTA